VIINDALDLSLGSEGMNHSPDRPSSSDVSGKNLSAVLSSETVAPRSARPATFNLITLCMEQKSGGKFALLWLGPRPLVCPSKTLAHKPRWSR